MDIPAITPWDDGDWSAVLAVARGDASAQDRAGAMWPAYAPLLAPKSSGPLVFGQIGQSLDGRVATPNGHSHYINGPAALTHLHRLRALSDAVVIGVGTALADDPQLTVRHAEGADPMRVVIDPNGRLDTSARCLATGGARCLIVRATEGQNIPGVDQIVLPRVDGFIAPGAVIAALAARGCRRILIEGGPTTLSHFVTAKVVDRLHIMIAPMIIGSGPAGLTLPAIDHLRGSLRPAVRLFRLPGDDVLCDCDLRP